MTVLNVNVLKAQSTQFVRSAHYFFFFGQIESKEGRSEIDFPAKSMTLISGGKVVR